MIRYWLDASSVIWCDREYFPLATNGKYWHWLETKFADGSVVTHKKIFGEIIKGTEGERPSEIALWTKSRKGAWCDYGCTDESKQLMGKIAELCYERYGLESSIKFLKGADPLLIARAAIDSGIVVTQESVNKEPRIPCICDHFKVKHMPMNRMNIALGMSLLR